MVVIFGYFFVLIIKKTIAVKNEDLFVFKKKAFSYAIKKTFTRHKL